MAQNKIKFQLARYKNNNKKSTGYQKYYLQKAYSQTLSQRGLIDHMTAHGLSVPRAIIEAVFSQVAQCAPEICAHGIPDGHHDDQLRWLRTVQILSFSFIQTPTGQKINYLLSRWYSICQTFKSLILVFVEV